VQLVSAGVAQNSRRDVAAESPFQRASRRC
jgi:hypothetical protein